MGSSCNNNNNNDVSNMNCGVKLEKVYDSTSSISPAPLTRQFWRAGNYDDRLVNLKPPSSQNGTSYLRIHPKFLHSNATSHKWAFGAVAELLDNSIDEIQNGATFVNVDKMLNTRHGAPAMLIQDNGGGMDPQAMRRCISFGFSDKNSKTSIGQYGNGFKTSSMRLGADVIVFSRHTNPRNRTLTQSVGLLSYSFLMKTRQDRIVVPMVDYMFNAATSTWNTLHSEQHVNNNLPILLQWSPFKTEAELLKQCDDIGPHGTKIIIYNLWHNDEGKLELDFEADPEDICLSGKMKNTTANEHHLANRLKHSLRAYLSILYLKVPENFTILLRGRVVEYHNIGNDLKYPQFIMYRPQNVEGSVITTIGFLKEAPTVNVHGFNVYHKNRLILPFWHVVTYSDSRGRGVVGVLEANFIEPIHNKQDFEKTPIFQKLETRLKEMTLEYWDYHCGLIGYIPKKAPRPMTGSHITTSDSTRQQGDPRGILQHAVYGSRRNSLTVGAKVSSTPRPITGSHSTTSDSTERQSDPHSIFQPVILGSRRDSKIGAKVSSTPAGAYKQEMNGLSIHVDSKFTTSKPPPHLNSSVNCTGSLPLKRKRHGEVAEPAKFCKSVDVTMGCRTEIAHAENIQHVIAPDEQFGDQEASNIIQENRKLHDQCEKYEKGQEELNLKVTRLKADIKEARREYARLLLESNALDKAKQGTKPVI